MFSIGLGCLLCAGVARAEQPGEPVQPAQGNYETMGPQNVGELRFHRSELSLGLGVQSYFSGQAPGTSGSWDARYGFNFNRFFSLEGAYTGAVGSGEAGGATTMSMVSGDLLVKPFGLPRFNPMVWAGAGWAGYSTTGNGPSDHATVAMPIGIGAMYRLTDRWVADGRLNANVNFADNLGPGSAGTDNWSLLGRVGATF
jgi:hypothetical protein